MLLLARVCYRYTPRPVHDENGRLLGYERRFAGDFWRPDWDELADELGCSVNTARAEGKLLEDLGLIRFQVIRAPTAADGARAVPEYVIPIPEAILSITDLPEAVQVSWAAPVQVSGTAPVQVSGTGAVQVSGTYQRVPTDKPTDKPSAEVGADAPTAPRKQLRGMSQVITQHPDYRVQTYIDLCRPEGVTGTTAAMILARVAPAHTETWEAVCQLWRENPAWRPEVISNLFERYDREVLALTPAPGRSPTRGKASGVDLSYIESLRGQAQGLTE